MIRKKISMLWAMLLVLSLVSRAQSQLRLPDAVNIALKNSLDLQLAGNKIKASTILDNYGYAGGLPAVTGSVTDNEQVTTVNQKLSTGNTIQRNNAAGNNMGANITGSILLFNGGRVIATKKRLAELVRQNKAQLNAAVQNLMADVMLGYYDIVRQQEYIKTIDGSIDASKQQLDLVKLRQQLGLANNADLFQAQIDLNDLQQSRLAQELVVAQAKAELLRLLTLSADSSIQVNDTIITDKGLKLETILHALDKNAEIEAAASQVKVNEWLVKETAAQRYPSIRANAGYAFSRNQVAAGNLLLNQNYGPTVGLSLSIPIFNGSIYRRQQQVAKIEVENARVQQQVLQRDYRAQVVKQYQAYENTISQLDTAAATYRLSNQLLQLSLLRFQLRQATIVEVKNSRKSFEDAGFRLVNLDFAAKSAEIELKRLGNLLINPE